MSEQEGTVVAVCRIGDDRAERLVDADSKEFLKIQTLAIISSALGIVGIVLSERLYNNIYVVTWVTILFAVMASAYSFLFMLNPSGHTAQQIVAIFVFGLFSLAFVPG